MRSLKEAGYTNKEISTLTAEMISKGLTFEQVIQATTIKAEIDLAEVNLTVQDLIDFIEKAKNPV